jgi:hypothetical protein
LSDGLIGSISWAWNTGRTSMLIWPGVPPLSGATFFPGGPSAIGDAVFLPTVAAGLNACF